MTLYQARKLMGLRPEDMADRLGVSTSSYRRWEHVNQMPVAKQLIARTILDQFMQQNPGWSALKVGDCGKAGPHSGKTSLTRKIEHGRIWAELHKTRTLESIASEYMYTKQWVSQVLKWYQEYLSGASK